MGACSGKKWIHNPLTQEQKKVNQEDLEKYISEGWVPGRSLKDKENISKGTSKAKQELFADPERGAKARENMSKAQKELYADPERGPPLEKIYRKQSKNFLLTL